MRRWLHPNRSEPPGTDQLSVTATPKAAAFVESVLRLEPRLATFDCDGTLWANDAGEGFFDWEIKRGLVSEALGRSMRARYADYKVGKVSEDDMCAEMVTMHRGLTEAEVQQAANQYFNENFVYHIFPEMRETVRRLQKSGCEVWAVSSTNEWVIRAAMKHFGIPENRILAAYVEIDRGRVTDRLVRVPTGEGKPRTIHESIRKKPDIAFGNSRWDTEMLGLARHAFAVNPNPDLEQTAKQRGWTVYWPDGVGRK